MSPEDKAARVMRGKLIANLSIEVDQTAIEKIFIETVAGRPYTDATRDAVIQAIISSDAIKTVVKTEFIPMGKCCCGATVGVCNCRVHAASEEEPS